MPLAQRSPAVTIPRQAAYGQQLSPRPMGVRQHPGMRPGQRPLGMRPTAAPPMVERPAPRPVVTFLTVAEVAAMMRVSKMTVYRLVHAGDLPAVRVGRSFRVPENDVHAYLQRSFFQAG